MKGAFSKENQISTMGDLSLVLNTFDRLQKGYPWIYISPNLSCLCKDYGASLSHVLIAHTQGKYGPSSLHPLIGELILWITPKIGYNSPSSTTFISEKNAL